MAEQRRQAQRRSSARASDPDTDQLAEAIAHEDTIRDEARKIREESGATRLTPELFLKLEPLLRRPIPAAFISEVPSGTGKPYHSTGVKSVQVQIDRMDAVLTPLWWRYSDEYEDEGKRCRVTVAVDVGDYEIRRSSWGGVDRGSTIGNVWKGSFTNAAKPAFARIGPGHEIYLGAPDLDPDTHEPSAKQQERREERAGAKPLPPDAAERKLPEDAAERLRKTVSEAGLDEHLPMKLRSFGASELTDLTIEQGFRLHEWASEGKAAEGKQEELASG